MPSDPKSGAPPVKVVSAAQLADGGPAMSGGAAALAVGGWCEDPNDRADMIALYESVAGPLLRTPTSNDYKRNIIPRLRSAFRRGELSLVPGDGQPAVWVSQAPLVPDAPPPEPPKGGAKTDPKATPAPKKELKATWKQDKAFCGDAVNLNGVGRNIGEADGEATVTAGGKTVATLKAKGTDSWDLPWTIKDVIFEGDGMPDKHEVTAELKAGGLSAKPDAPLAVQRVPDMAPAAITFARSSGRFGWTAAFKAGVKKGKVEVQQTLQIIPAWIGKWVSFNRARDGIDGWAFIKKVGAAWKYWDTAEAAADKWKALPRAIASYTVNNIFFIKSGASFVGREDATKTWPEAFPDAPDLATKKAAWLGNIHSVWDNKFAIERKDCKSGGTACCRWKLSVKVAWSDTPGDKTVYAVWAQEWERSNAKDWFLTENRLGVAAHECGHLLGAYDEYTGGAVDTATNKIENDSIMGQNLTKGFPRHLDGLRDEIKKIINAKIGRTWDFEVKDA
jgi:hypothetical protein